MTERHTTTQATRRNPGQEDPTMITYKEAKAAHEKAKAAYEAAAPCGHCHDPLTRHTYGHLQLPDVYCSAECRDRACLDAGLPAAPGGPAHPGRR